MAGFGQTRQIAWEEENPGLAAFNLILYGSISPFPRDENGFLEGFKKPNASPNKTRYFAGCFVVPFGQIQQSPASRRNGNGFIVFGLKRMISSHLL